MSGSWTNERRRSELWVSIAKRFKLCCLPRYSCSFFLYHDTGWKTQKSSKQVQQWRLKVTNSVNRTVYINKDYFLVVKSSIRTAWKFKCDVAVVQLIQQSTIHHRNRTTASNSTSLVTECRLIHCSIVKLIKWLIIGPNQDNKIWGVINCAVLFSHRSADRRAYRCPTTCLHVAGWR